MALNSHTLVKSKIIKNDHKSELRSGYSHICVPHRRFTLEFLVLSPPSPCCSGKMDITDLRQQIAAVRSGGGNVIMVNATCGTTVLGAFDPVSEMADICEEFGIWLHCDVSKTCTYLPSLLSSCLMWF